jgi:hypothetical protein
VLSASVFFHPCCVSVCLFSLVFFLVLRTVRLCIPSILGFLVEHPCVLHVIWLFSFFFLLCFLPCFFCTPYVRLCISPILVFLVERLCVLHVMWLFFSFFLLGGFGLSIILSYKYIRNQIGVLFYFGRWRKKAVGLKSACKTLWSMMIWPYVVRWVGKTKDSTWHRC